jgi:hypothetical protein
MDLKDKKSINRSIHHMFMISGVGSKLRNSVPRIFGETWLRAGEII